MNPDLNQLDESIKEEQLNKIKLESLSLKLNDKLNVIKVASIIIGAIITFIFITSPDSILSRKKNKEELAKERTQMLVDVLLKTKNPTELELAYNTIKATYQVYDSSWVIAMDKIVQKRINLLFELKDLDIKYNSLLRNKNDLDAQSNKRLIQEIDEQAIKLKEIIEGF
jgi:hypothetical protein